MRFFPQARRPVRALTALAVAVSLTLASGLVALASVPVVRLSTDPYTNTSSFHQTEVEPDSFAFGATIVDAFQVGRFSDGGASNVGWATSTDNGANWVNGFLPGTTVYSNPPNSQWARDTDPAVAYDAAHGVWMIVSLPLPPGSTIGGAVLVSRSTDGGLTWQNPVAVVTQIGLDKTWIACDNSAISPYFGHCYVEWDNNFSGNLMQMSTSADGGLTWGPVRTPSGAGSGLGGQPVVQPNGTVVVPYSGNYASILSYRSTDGGTTWGGAVTVSGVSYHSVAGPLRAYPMPSAEIDPQGRVYVVWHDCRFRSGCASNDIVMSTSTNGLTWSAPVRIPIDPTTSTVDHFLPGIAVDWTKAGPPAHLGLMYYYYPTASCTAATCQLTVGFVASLDGGATWSPSTQVAGPMTTAWLPNTSQGYMVGDYFSTSISADGKAHPIFALATAPGAQYDEAMYTSVAGLALKALFPAVTTAPARRAGGDKPVFFAPSDRPLPQGLPTAN